jgi:hypothetical protein
MDFRLLGCRASRHGDEIQFFESKNRVVAQATMATAMADDCRDPGAVGAVQPGDIGAIFETRGPDR